MTTPTDYQNAGKLERMLDGIQRKVTDIGKDVRAVSERVTDLADTTAAIYEAVSYQRDSPSYGRSPDSFLDEADE